MVGKAHAAIGRESMAKPALPTAIFRFYLLQVPLLSQTVVHSGVQVFKYRSPQWTFLIELLQLSC